MNTPGDRLLFLSSSFSFSSFSDRSVLKLTYGNEWIEREKSGSNFHLFLFFLSHYLLLSHYFRLRKSHLSLSASSQNVMSQLHLIFLHFTILYHGRIESIKGRRRVRERGEEREEKSREGRSDNLSVNLFPHEMIISFSSHPNSSSILSSSFSFSSLPPHFTPSFHFISPLSLSLSHSLSLSVTSSS